MSDTITITYRLAFPDGVSRIFPVKLDARTLELRHPDADPPFWTALAFHKCSNCPLSGAVPRCPVALALVELVALCSDLVSYRQVTVEVETPERTIVKDTTVQRGVASLMGLLMGASGCPKTAFFRPMARFHLPFASEEETIYRATSMYMLAQYFAQQRGAPVDVHLSGLGQAYREMHIINMHITERLRAVVERDGSVNALILLDLFSKALPDTIEDSLEEIRYLFEPFLETLGLPKPPESDR